MCVRCNRCGWTGDASEMSKSYYDPSPAGIALPTGYYTDFFCPECGSEDYDDGFDLANMFDLEDASDYEIDASAFNDRLTISFDRKGIIDSIKTSRGKWVFVEK